MKNVQSVAQYGLIISLTISLFSCQKEAKLSAKNKSQFGAEATTTALSNAETVSLPPLPDHIILVWFENKGYNKIIGSSNAPYINSLVKRGTLFTNTYGLTHPSYPNYVRFFSGDDNGVTSNDCIDGKPKTGLTLYNALAAKNISFRWYSEGLPAIGSGACSAGYYREKHNPTTIFSQVPDYINRPFSLLDAALQDPNRYANMPRVICVTPNMINDMHDGTIQQGDTWLKNKFSKWIDWSVTHNSILVVYWDESESTGDNRIPVIAVGQGVKAGYQITTKYDHYSWTKTICSMFSASTTWTSNLSSRSVISGCWN